MAVFDPKQFLSTNTIWTKSQFEQLEDKTGKENIIHLHNQMRIDASMATITWIRNLIDKGIVS